MNTKCYRLNLVKQNMLILVMVADAPHIRIKDSCHMALISTINITRSNRFVKIRLVVKQALLICETHHQIHIPDKQ